MVRAGFWYENYFNYKEAVFPWFPMSIKLAINLVVVSSCTVLDSFRIMFVCLSALKYIVEIMENKCGLFSWAQISHLRKLFAKIFERKALAPDCLKLMDVRRLVLEEACSFVSFSVH